MAFDLKGLISFDATKLDKAAFKKWAVSGAQLLEPAIITPGNLDKVLFFDNLEKLIDPLFKQLVDELNNPTPLVVGEAPVSAADVSNYLGKFSDVPDETKQILRDNPKLIKRLAKFNEKEQKMIVGNPLLLLALQVLIPMLFELFLNRFKG